MRERIFEGLNDAQREAVEAVRGPVAILAGAGTGKTTTITRRIANQVLGEAFTPDQILAVTFTTKAAGEMRSRLRALGVDGVRAITFHAEALAQFRRFSEDQPEIVASKGQLLHGIAKRLPMPHRFTALRDLATEIEWAKNRSIPARDYLDKLDGHEAPIPAELMHKVYVTYEKQKRKADLIDFEDLLERTAGLLADDPRALARVRARYAAFTVDEYQDVNLLQQTLLDLWVGARDDVCVVGDDYQSIFGFTGATPRYLLRFAGRWDHTTVVTLRDNYRSTPEVLAVANRLTPRLGGTSKRLRATQEAGARPALRSFDDGGAEVRWIVEEARRLHEQHDVAWEQIAVLFRINGRSEDYEEAFAQAGIPYQVKDGSFLNRPAAKAFFARAGRARPGVSVAEAVRAIAVALGYQPEGRYEGGDEGTRQADLHRLVALAAEFDGDDLPAFCADLRSRFAPDQEGRGINLMTYHRAKGLEFDAVFLPRLEAKELPFALATTDEDLAEERRLLYVGITRAKRFLALTNARTRPGERRSKPKPSPFLRELTPRSEGGGGSVRPSSPGTHHPEPPTSRDPMFEVLRKWRATEALSRGLPPYVIFHDSTLAEIAAQRPTNLASLRQIPGVGPTKMQRYGETLLAILSSGSEHGDAVPASG